MEVMRDQATLQGDSPGAVLAGRVERMLRSMHILTFGGGTNAYVTRLHVRYDAKSFPEDLVFLETKDRTNFQGRYVMHHPWRGSASCNAANSYRASLPTRFQQEARNLADLTGWSQKEIEARMEKTGQSTRGAK